MKEIKKQRKEENAMEGNKITLIFFYNVSSKDKGLPETLYRRNPT